MIASRYPAKDILDLTHIFADVDITRRGTISLSEFKGLFLESPYQDTELRSMFNCIVSIGNHLFSLLSILKMLVPSFWFYVGTQALNGTGNILYTEFLACTLDAKGPIDQKRFLEVFEQIDRSNKGCITKEDLRQIIPRSITDKYLHNVLEGANVNGRVGLSFEMFLTSLTIGAHTWGLKHLPLHDKYSIR